MTQADSVHSTPPTNTSASSEPAGATESPADALYFPTDISPEELFEVLGRLRSEAEAQIERLIDLVDEIDSFDEREPDADEEPDLAHTEAGATAGLHGVIDGELEFATTEIEDARGKYAANHLWADGGEPVLGSSNDHHGNGASYWHDTKLSSLDTEGDGCADDREGDELQHGGDEHDGCEPDVDGEPSLGWTMDGVLGNSDG